MLKKQKYNVAIAGATGAVGAEFIALLENRRFPVGELKLLASQKSVGKKLTFSGQEVAVCELTADSFKGIDIALFSAGADRSRQFAPCAVKAGAVVIDNSSAFRMDPHVPLVVPEINPDAAYKHEGIIANPNCTTIIMGVVVWPIHQINRVKHIVVSTYQAVSGAGAKALAELNTQQRDLVEGRKPKPQVFKHVIANNIFSHDSKVMDNGYNQEELKMIHETHKIFQDDGITISPTCVRVPIARAHSESIYMELARVVNLNDIHQVLSRATGVKVVDEPDNNLFPMPLDCSGRDAVLVGRIRRDPSVANAVSLFCCGDQLLKGAALNAVQIAELLI
ncbi:MAG: aspartate-semialdehyde dehydrogenase [Deltaproteobacteria bacterium]|nr:aspartate-semialdehyde dehydrogenase [Deltaproteobacteria bacterium]